MTLSNILFNVGKFYKNELVNFSMQIECLTEIFSPQMLISCHGEKTVKLVQYILCKYVIEYGIGCVNIQTCKIYLTNFVSYT